MEIFLRGDRVELHYSELKNFINPADLHFETTAELSPTDEIIGQPIAHDSLIFGLSVKSPGYNIYLCGEPGTGKTTFAKRFAQKQADKEPVPPDLVFIYNFENPKAPDVLYLPQGMGKCLRDDMDEFINRLVTDLPKLFANKDFETQKSEIIKVFQEQRDQVIKAMTEEAGAKNFGIKNTNSGIYFMPIIDGEMINEEQYDALDQEKKDNISRESIQIQRKAAEAMRKIKEYEKTTRREVEELEFATALFAVGRHINPLLNEYKDHQNIVDYLLAVKEDILDNIEDFVTEDNEDEENIQAYLPWYNKKNTEETLTKYKINLLTDNSNATSAPVVVDFNPTYSNLVGEIEYDNEFGNFTTDFMKIKPGLLHKANGGYLILQARDVLSNYHSWDIIRRVLLTGEIVTEPQRELPTGIAVSGIKPKPVKANIKVILVGNYELYALLYNYDDDFQKLFKVRADFDYEMKNDERNTWAVCRFIKGFVEREKSLEFDRYAVARLLEYSSRLSEAQNKLTTQFPRITEVLVESTALAKAEGAELVSDMHISRAIENRHRRLMMYEGKMSELIDDGVIMIDTEGKRVGQINGLAVIDTGDYAFAKPSRITATTYVGKSGIINIEKEAEMSGSIHDKGVQVLIGYLGQTYAQDFPLSLSCRICFEQNYNGIDGDSASSTELYAVLSSLSRLPISQHIAVTGSINQHGYIQPIGGVSYKIEGFFDLCNKRGLNGNEGVIIPQQNVNDLVLNDEVIEAVRAGKFHIYPITTVDEGIEILTGTKAGVPNAKGKYPAGSVHALVMKRLKEFFQKAVSEE